MKLMQFNKKAASLPHVDGSFVFARSRQCSPHLINGSLGRLESTIKTASRSVLRFLQVSRSWQTDRRTDHATSSVTIGHIYTVFQKR